MSHTLRSGLRYGPSKSCTSVSRTNNVNRVSQRLQPRERIVSLSSSTEISPSEGAADVSQGGVEIAPDAAPLFDRPSFEQLGIDRLFLTGMMKMKISRPSDIQAAVIPEILSTDNVAMQSYTGSGKTLAFLLPAMTLAIARAEAMYKTEQRDVPLQLLVVAPSQELAMQIVRVAQGLLPDEHRRMVQQCIGGANPKYQMDSLLMNKPLVVVGTPGRVSEFVRLGALKLHRCPMLILDEADQLLSPAFAEDMNHIISHCGKALPGTSPSSGSADPLRSRQTVLVSATLSQSILSKMMRWCGGKPPRLVTAAGAPAPRVAEAGTGPLITAAVPAWGWGAHGWDGPASEMAPKTQSSAGGVEGAKGLIPTMPPHLRHYYLVVDPRHKADALRRCIHALDSQRVLVFMNYQQRLRDTMFKLEARGMKVASLHGEMDKLSRSNILNDFRRGRLRALVVSDVVARGLDVAECDAVFHAEMPSSAAHYAHRAGRTGRMDAPGTVVSVVSQSEMFVVEKLSKGLGVPILEAHIYRGELVLGPAPASLRYDGEDDTDKKKASKTSKVASADKPSTRSSATFAEASDAPGGDTEQPQPKVPISTSASGRQGADHRGSNGSTAGAGAASSKGGVGKAPWMVSKRPERGRKVAGSDDDDDDDEDDGADVALNVAQLVRQVQQSKALAAGKAISPTNARLGSGIRSDLEKELQELHGEKASAKIARRGAKDDDGT